VVWSLTIRYGRPVVCAASRREWLFNDRTRITISLELGRIAMRLRRAAAYGIVVARPTLRPRALTTTSVARLGLGDCFGMELGGRRRSVEDRWRILRF